MILIKEMSTTKLYIISRFTSLVLVISPFKLVLITLKINFKI
jgi:hypothetical protein